ncbi:MAG: hypothetical protein CSA36_06530 [Draconibacterium sp.]|nr:MAG: hypothetical protein CSA36_06530 [Draconibacterium sp.]
MNKTGKIVTIILWVLIVISAILVVSLLVNISENETDATMGGWISTNLVWAYVLIALGAGIAILAGLFQMITNKAAAKRGLISLVFMAAVVLVAYFLASPEIPKFPGVDKFINNGTLNETVAKLVDTGLIATYIFLGIAILAIVYSSVSRVFK